MTTATTEMTIIQSTLSLDNVCSEYRVKFTPEEAQLFCAIRDHKLGELLDEIDAIVPVKNYKPGNPNNGHPHHKYLIGREHSRVLYVHVVRAYLPDDEAVQTILSHLARLANEYGADEYGANETMLERNEIEYRIWWD